MTATGSFCTDCQYEKGFGTFRKNLIVGDRPVPIDILSFLRDFRVDIETFVIARQHLLLAIVKNQNFYPPRALSCYVSVQTQIELQQICLGPPEFITITALGGIRAVKYSYVSKLSAYGVGGKSLIRESEKMLLHVMSLDQPCSDPISRPLMRLEHENNEVPIQYVTLRICGALPPSRTYIFVASK